METPTPALMDILLPAKYLYCKGCSKLLRPPVMLVEEIGNVCNTCFQSETSNYRLMKYVGNNVIQEMMQHLCIPCENALSGCDKQIIYDDISDHEKNCKFRKIHCVMSGCEWLGPRNDFVNHLTTIHNKNTSNTYENVQIVIGLKDNTELVELINFGLAKFVIRFKTKIDENKILCKVYDLENGASGYIFQAIFSGGNSNELVAKCFVTKKIERGEFDEQEASEIDLTTLKQILNASDALNIEIRIRSKTTKQLTKSLEEILSCPVCEEKMKRPVHVCTNGHSLCGSCKSKLNECPQCRSKFEGTRNYLAESITNLMHYNCENNVRGCMFLGFPDDLDTHKKICFYKELECMYPSCTYRNNLSKLLSHYHTLHAVDTYHSDTLEVPIKYNKHESLKRKFFMLAHGHVFRVTLKKDDIHTYWAVEYLTGENHEEYFYEVTGKNVSNFLKISKTVPTLKREYVNENLYSQCVSFSNNSLRYLESNNGIINYVIKIISAATENNV